MIPIVFFAAGFAVAALLLRRDEPADSYRRTLYELRRLLAGRSTLDAESVRRAGDLLDDALGESTRT